MRYVPANSIIHAFTFQELIAYGLENHANVVNGMPWSFTLTLPSGLKLPVTHENDNEYIVSYAKFLNGNVLIVTQEAIVYQISTALFNILFTKIGE